MFVNFQNLFVKPFLSTVFLKSIAIDFQLIIELAKMPKNFRNFFYVTQVFDLILSVATDNFCRLNFH